MTKTELYQYINETMIKFDGSGHSTRCLRSKYQVVVGPCPPECKWTFNRLHRGAK
jgi:hypothetical protein